MGEKSFIALLIVFNLIFLVFIGGIVIFIKEYRKKKKSHNEQVQSINTMHRKVLLETQVEIQQQTMNHIGQEIHDNIGQKLTLASIYLQQIEHASKAPQINDNIIAINGIISESLIELRQLSKSLTDDTISERTISDLLNNECKKIKDSKISSVSFKDELTCDIDSYRIKSILLRITQEFFQNSIKHADCKNLHLKLFINSGYVCLRITDDGKGFEIDDVTNSGIGLRNMKKRTEMLNGIFNLKSSSNMGTELIIKIPLK